MTCRNVETRTSLLVSRQRRRIVAGAFVRRLAVGLSVWVAAALTLVVVDAAWPLRREWRYAASIVAAASLAFAVMNPFVRMLFRRTSPLRIARLIEIARELRGNPLINALQLAPRAAPRPQCSEGTDLHSHHTPVDVAFAARAVAIGDACADRLVGAQFGTATENRRALQIVIACLAPCVLVTIFCPRLIRFEWPRFVTPGTFHPAYTWFDFNLATNPDSDAIYVGDDVSIDAVISGPGASKIGSIELLPFDRRRQRIVDDGFIRLAMQPTARAHVGAGPDAAHRQATLRDVREPSAWVVMTPRGTSSPIVIHPIDRPRIMNYRVTKHEPPYASLPPEVIDRSDIPIVVRSGGTVQIDIESSIQLKEIDWRELNGASPRVRSTVDTENPRLSRTDIETASLGLLDFELWLVGENGKRSAQAVRISVRTVRDEPPMVRIESPGRDAAASPTAGIPLRVIATDDLGLSTSTLHLVQRRGGVAPSPGGEESLSDIDPPQRADDITIPMERLRSDHSYDSTSGDSMVFESKEFVLDLAARDIRVGDVLYYTVNVADNRPAEFGGAQPAHSQQYKIVVIDDDTIAMLASARSGRDASGIERGLNGDSSESGSAASGANQSEPGSTSMRSASSADDRQRGGADGGVSGIETTDPLSINPESGRAARSASPADGDRKDPTGDAEADEVGRAAAETKDDTRAPTGAGRDADIEAGGGDAPLHAADHEATSSAGETDTSADRDASLNQFDQFAIFDRPVDQIEHPVPGQASLTPSERRDDRPREQLVYEFVRPRKADSIRRALHEDEDDDRSGRVDGALMPTAFSLSRIDPRYRELVVDYFRRLAESEANVGKRIRDD